jgi:hypothetical protein
VGVDARPHTKPPTPARIPLNRAIQHLSPRSLPIREGKRTRAKPPKPLSLAGRCSRVLVAVRGDWDRKRTAEWPLRSVLEA